MNHIATPWESTLSTGCLFGFEVCSYSILTVCPVFGWFFFLSLQWSSKCFQKLRSSVWWSTLLDVDIVVLCAVWSCRPRETCFSMLSPSMWNLVVVTFVIYVRNFALPWKRWVFIKIDITKKNISIDCELSKSPLLAFDSCLL